MGPGQFFVAWVSHLWFGFEFGKFCLIMSNFLIFSLSGQKKSLRVGSKSSRVKGGSASYLLRVKSKLGAVWVRAHLQFYIPIKLMFNIVRVFSKWMLTLIIRSTRFPSRQFNWIRLIILPNCRICSIPYIDSSWMYMNMPLPQVNS